MPFQNKLDLTNSVSSWLNRDDLDPIIPDWITLVEAEVNRVVVSKHLARTTLTLDADEVELPTDVLQVGHLYLTGDGGVVTVKVTTPDRVQMYRDQYVSGMPRVCAIIAVDDTRQTLLLGPIPDMEYEAELIYEPYMVPLVAPGDSNWLLINHPDVYLYGTLMHSAPWLKDDERLATWGQAYSKAFEQLKIAKARSEYGNSPLIARPKRAL